MDHCEQCGADNPDVLQAGKRLCRNCATFFYCKHFKSQAVWCPVGICGPIKAEDVVRV